MNLIEIRQLREEGLTYATIGKIYKVSHQRIEQKLKGLDKYKNWSLRKKAYQSHYKSHIVHKCKPRKFCQWCKSKNES